MILASGSLDIRFWGKYKGEIQRTVVGWLVTNSYRVFQGSIFFFADRASAALAPGKIPKRARESGSRNRKLIIDHEARHVLTHTKTTVDF
jgi:hypothetical protein